MHNFLESKRIANIEKSIHKIEFGNFLEFKLKTLYITEGN